MSPSDESQADFPWHIGVFDAHCHPTDNMPSTSTIRDMKARTLTIMATRAEDQDLVGQVAATYGPERIVPCFGWHPWFAHQISPGERPVEDKTAHYRSVLQGSLSSSGNQDHREEDVVFFRTLPEPKPLGELLSDLRTRLVAHPTALVGEIGLDRAFRLPMPWSEDELRERDPSITPGSREARRLSPFRVSVEHQKSLLKAQLQLAGELRRPVSLHSVQGHGLVLEVLRDLWRGYERKGSKRATRKKTKTTEVLVSDNEDDSPEEEGNQKEEKPLPFPPRICMHSYSGRADSLAQFLHPSAPSEMFFSFSSVINLPPSAAEDHKTFQVVRALPADRILVESDFHEAGAPMDDLLEEVTRTVCRIRGWTLEQGVTQLARNYQRFVHG
ncbi:hypothetical protein VTN31DRAFT_2007 [Thermomyces dupontii]|uniref:uncharacterized protein n=1 Tax=Talaromyces thermophilus TaxID=28565 RepID=UPI0037420893